ncbi:MAG: hypothetical protein ACI9R3_006082, partial [Verrucomicrobiales bacterium]
SSKNNDWMENLDKENRRLAEDAMRRFSH